MKCSKCGHLEMRKLGKNATTDFDTIGPKWHSLHKPKTPHEALIGAGIFAVSTGAKLALSNVYQCNNCDHRQRQWFD